MAWLRAYRDSTDINWTEEAEGIRDGRRNSYKDYPQSRLNGIYGQYSRGCSKLKLTVIVKSMTTFCGLAPHLFNRSERTLPWVSADVLY